MQRPDEGAPLHQSPGGLAECCRSAPSAAARHHCSGMGGAASSLRLSLTGNGSRQSSVSTSRRVMHSIHSDVEEGGYRDHGSEDKPLFGSGRPNPDNIKKKAMQAAKSMVVDDFAHESYIPGGMPPMYEDQQYVRSPLITDWNAQEGLTWKKEYEANFAPAKLTNVKGRFVRGREKLDVDLKRVCFEYVPMPKLEDMCARSDL